jgi:hypothetical protein
MTELQPYPENIDGSVSYSHEIHHKINWGYVVIGVGVIAVVLFLREKTTKSEDNGVTVQ